MIISMSTYLVWQVLYFQFVIVARRDKIKQGRATSFTFLINDKKRLIGKIAAKVPEGLREGAFIVSASQDKTERTEAEIDCWADLNVLPRSAARTSGVHVCDAVDPDFRPVRFQVLVFSLPDHRIRCERLERR